MENFTKEMIASYEKWLDDVDHDFHENLDASLEAMAQYFSTKGKKR